MSWLQIFSYVVLLLGAAWLIGVSIFMVARPLKALEYLGKFASTNLINYTELIIRMIVGFAFVFFAALSRNPLFFTIFGWFLVASAAVLMLIPRRWHSSYAVFWSEKLPPAFVRLAAPISFIAGALLIYSVN